MVKLPGSMPAPLFNAQSLGPAPADERLQITVLLRPNPATPPVAPGARLAERQHLTREEHAGTYGAREQAMNAVAAFAQGCGLVVVERSAARRSVSLSGAVAHV